MTNRKSTDQVEKYRNAVITLAPLSDEEKHRYARAMGRNLKFARSVLKITQVELARLLDIEQSALSRVESGDQHMNAAQVRIADKICQQGMQYILEEKPEKELERIERIRRRIFGELPDREALKNLELEVVSL